MPRPRLDAEAARPRTRRARAGQGPERVARRRAIAQPPVALPGAAQQDVPDAAQPDVPDAAQQDVPDAAQPQTQATIQPNDTAPEQLMLPPPPQSVTTPPQLESRRPRRTNAGQNPRYSQDGPSPATQQAQRKRRRTSSTEPLLTTPPPSQPTILPSLICGRCHVNEKSLSLQPCGHTFCRPCARQLFGMDGICCHCKNVINSIVSFNLSDL